MSCKTWSCVQSEQVEEESVVVDGREFFCGESLRTLIPKGRAEIENILVNQFQLVVLGNCKVGLSGALYRDD